MVVPGPGGLLPEEEDGREEAPGGDSL